ncbi:Surfeit locus protein 1 [Anthophora plagiata]
MKSVISRYFIKVKDTFNIIQFQRKTNFSQPSRNATSFQKQLSKVFKFNLFKSKNKYDYSSPKENINFVGYSLLGIPIVAFALGTWQIQRYQWKLNLIEKLESRTNHEPIELPQNLEELDSKEYYPIKVKGQFLYENEFIIGYRGLLVDGKPPKNNILFGIEDAKRGYNVVTPFKVSDQDLTILVNRGWIPRSLKNPARRQENQIKDETEIVGILRLNERKPPFIPKNRPHGDMWFYRDVNAMAEKTKSSPIYLELKSNKDLQQYPMPNQTRVELRNEHMSYILTWYCLSGTTAYMWFRKFIRGIPLLE